MRDPPLAQRFCVLCEIVRAQHFAWRQAVQETCPGIDPAAVVGRMWEITGRQTATAYLKRLDPARPLAPQIAASVAWSSQCMGEDAVVEAGAHAEEAFVRHAACPWLDWHRRLGLLAEDLAGCDRWFTSTVDEINRVLGTALRVETQASQPEGNSACRRRFWVQQDG